MSTDSYIGALNGDETEAPAFVDAVSASLARLQERVPCGRWTLTRIIGDERAMLHTPAAVGMRAPMLPASGNAYARMVWAMAAARPAGPDAGARPSAPGIRSFDCECYSGFALYQTDGRPLGTLGAAESRRGRSPRGNHSVEAVRDCARRLIDLVEQELALMRAGRSALVALLRQHRGSAWLGERLWRQALDDEEVLRRTLALPAAVLAVTPIERTVLCLRGTVRNPQLHGLESVLSGLLGREFVGALCAPATQLALLPECDRRRAHEIERRVGLLLDNYNVKVRCRAVSAGFDESLRNAALQAQRAVGAA